MVSGRGNSKGCDRTMQKIKRLEAGDSRQARGMDTQAMLPVLAMVAELVSMLGFRWVSVPDLRYQPVCESGDVRKTGRDSKRNRVELPGAGSNDAGGRPGRRVSADRDGSKCDPWPVLHSSIAIGNFLMLSPSFPPLHTVHETFASYGVPSYPNRFISYFPVIVWYP